MKKTDYEKDRLHKKLRTVLAMLVKVLRHLSRLMNNVHNYDLLTDNVIGLRISDERVTPIRCVKLFTDFTVGSQNVFTVCGCCTKGFSVKSEMRVEL